MKSTYYLLVLLWLVSSCNTSTEQPVFPIIDTADSLYIVNNFALAAAQPQFLDSIVEANISLVGRDTHLLPLHTYNLAAFYYKTGQFEVADSIALSYTITESNDQPYLGLFYNLLGNIRLLQSDQEAGIEYSKKAIAAFEQAGRVERAAAMKINIANLFLSRLDEENAYKYSKEAVVILEEKKDSLYLPIGKGILAVAALKMDKVKEGEVAAKEALALSERYGNIQGLVLANYAAGEVANEYSRYEEAVVYFDQTIEQAEQYRLYQQILSAKAGKLSALTQLGKYEEGIEEGEGVITLANQLKIEDIKYNTFKNLALCYHHNGEPTKAYELMRESEELYRLKNNKRNEEIIQELLIKYETEKKDKQLLLQEREILRNRWVMLMISFVGALVVIAFWSYRRSSLKNRKILVAQQKNEVLLALAKGEEQERKRLAGELHDGIASDLIALQLQLQNKGKSLDEDIKSLQQIHQQVRNVAHNLSPIDFSSSSIHQAMEEFTRRISTDDCIVTYYGDESKDALEETSAHILYRLLQEIIQNAVKHAQAKEIVVQVLPIDNGMQWMIEDDGIGMDDNSQTYARLREKLQNRLNKIGGEVRIDTQLGRGVVVTVLVT